MKKTLTIFSVFAITGAFAQCPEITCPSDTTVTLDPGQCDGIVTFDMPTGIDPCNSVDLTFTNCGVEGQFGPTQTQVDNEYSGGPLDGQVTITTQGIQEWTVPSTGVYTIEAAGAQGGPYVNSAGHGAIMRADISLTAGQTLKILVGQRGLGGSTSYPHGFAGGGGTFVALSDNTPLIVAGGGGIDYTLSTGIILGQTTNLGASAGSTPGNSGDGGTTGDNTGPGGGFFTDGASAGGGSAFVNGGAGAYSTEHTWIEGGFGGGGVRFGSWGEGCGGGYSGGNGGISSSSWEGAGGGGSFVEPTATNLATSNGLYENSSTFNTGSVQDLASYNTGNGYVIISVPSTLTATQTAGLASGSVFPSGTTTNTFEVNDGNGNTATCSFDVTIISSIDVGISGNGTTLTANNGNADSYQWINCADSSVVADANGQSFTPTANGDYAVIINEGNCTDTSLCAPVTNVGVDENLLSGVELYPNPNNGTFYIEFSQNFNGKVEIYDAQGRKVEELQADNQKQVKIDLNGDAGVYLIKASSANGQKFFKLIKE